MTVMEITNPEQKSEICNKILRSLPQWFGIESAIVDYVRDVQKLETWAAQVDNEIIGFVSLGKHNEQSAEVHVMGVLEKYHRSKIGQALIERSEESLRQQGFKFFQVKTLSPSRPDVNYDKTRQFYLKMGFTPIEEFKTLWGEHNPCLLLIKNLEPRTLLSHVEINVSDYSKSISFYETFLLPLGWKKLVSQKSHTTFSDGTLKIVLCPVEEKFKDSKFHRKQTGLNHLAFYAKSKEQVNNIFSEVLKANNIECLYDGKPSGDSSYYAVYFEDPDRIKIEIVFAENYCCASHWTNQLPSDFSSNDSVITFQEARTSDIPQIKSLMENVFGPFPKLEELFAKWITQEQYSVQIAKLQDKVVGVSTWCIKADNDFSKYETFGKKALDFMNDQKIAWVVNLAVYPEYRKNKIGQRLSLAQFNWLKKQNCSVVVGSSWVNGSNDHSQHLYIKAGFEKLGESKEFLRLQMQHGATCAVCKTSECNCNSILYGVKASDLLGKEGLL